MFRVASVAGKRASYRHRPSAVYMKECKLGATARPGFRDVCLGKVTNSVDDHDELNELDELDAANRGEVNKPDTSPRPEKPKQPSVSARRVLGLLQPYAYGLILAGVLLIISNGMGLAFPL